MDIILLVWHISEAVPVHKWALVWLILLVQCTMDSGMTIPVLRSGHTFAKLSQVRYKGYSLFFYNTTVVGYF